MYLFEMTVAIILAVVLLLNALVEMPHEALRELLGAAGLAFGVRVFHVCGGVGVHAAGGLPLPDEAQDVECRFEHLDGALQ